MRLESLRQLFLVRIRVFLREPEAVFWTFGFPIAIALALGIAFRAKGPEKLHVAVEMVGIPDRLGSVEEEARWSGQSKVLAALRADETLVASGESERDAREMLRTGKVSVVVVPGDPIVFRFDPTRPESRVARLAAEDALDRAKSRPPAYASLDAPVTEKGSRYIDFLIPGLLGMNIMSASMWGIGWSVVDSRSKKLLKRLAATPMPRANYLLAFMIGHVLLVSALMVFVLAFARIAFGVQIFGSWLALAFVSMLGAMSFAGMGVLMCSRTDSSEVLSGMNNAVMLPMFIASGVFFSSAHFPAVIQPLIRILPLTALNEALRAIMTDGAPLHTVAFQIAVLTIWGTLTFAVGLKIFRWT